jgi:hypothetical protein
VLGISEILDHPGIVAFPPKVSGKFGHICNSPDFAGGKLWIPRAIVLHSMQLSHFFSIEYGHVIN